ncbi:MAG: hypothetical protein HRT42_01180 [Campylobacteraceae bacterium]|nr:hypothetical protein [Campylobacteraceae bacterium]
MFTQDVKISINGLEKEQANQVINSFLYIFNIFNSLDLRRFSSLIVSDKFDKDVKQISLDNQVIMKNKFTEKNNTHALVLTIKKDNDFETILILKSSFAINLLKNESNVMRYRDAIHIIHHELAHIHDNNKKIDSRVNLLLTKRSFLIQTFYPICELTWSEYIANFISSSSAKKSIYPLVMAKRLLSQIKSKEKIIKEIIGSVDKNLGKEEIEKISLHINVLIKTSSYLLGYLHGLKISLAQLDSSLDKEIKKSYFKKTWDNLSYELYSIRKDYPDCFRNETVFDSLSLLIESMYKR